MKRQTKEVVSAKFQANNSHDSLILKVENNHTNMF